MTDALLDGWADALGQVLANTRREWLRDRELMISEIRGESASQMLALSDRINTKITEFELKIAERLAAIKDDLSAPAEVEAPDVERIERELKMSLALEVERLRAERAEFELRVERAVAERLAAIKDGAAGPPGEPGAPVEVEAPEDIAPMVAKALSLLSEAPPLVLAQPAPAVVNVTLPPPRTERSRVTHDAQGRVVGIERDVA